MEATDGESFLVAGGESTETGFDGLAPGLAGPLTAFERSAPELERPAPGIVGFSWRGPGGAPIPRARKALVWSRTGTAGKTELAVRRSNPHGMD